MDVLVMVATGNVGGALVELLRARHVRVHAITRKPRTWPDDVQSVVGDANDPASLAGVAAGMDGVFLMSGYAAEAQLLADLGSGHAALLSSSSVPLADSGNAMAAYHRESEEAVKASDAAWTIVRPCSMQSNVTRGRCGLSSSACVVDRDGVAVRVSERERPAEGAIDRLSQDRHAVLDESVMKGLGVVGPQPQRHAEAGLSTVEIGFGQRVSDRKRDWLGGEHDGVRGSGCAREP